jgi:hypothetical protein
MKTGWELLYPPCRQCCGAGTGFGGSLIKLPEPDPSILNYGSGSLILYSSKIFLSFLMFYCLFDNIIFHWAQKFPWDPDLSGPVINWPPGSGSVSQGYGSPVPEPEEINTDPQHCLSGSCTNDAFFLYHHSVGPSTLHILFIAQEIKTDKVIESAPVMRNLKSDITR